MRSGKFVSNATSASFWGVPGVRCAPSVVIDRVKKSEISLPFTILGTSVLFDGAGIRLGIVLGTSLAITLPIIVGTKVVPFGNVVTVGDCDTDIEVGISLPNIGCVGTELLNIGAIDGESDAMMLDVEGVNVPFGAEFANDGAKVVKFETITDGLFVTFVKVVPSLDGTKVPLLEAVPSTVGIAVAGTDGTSVLDTTVGTSDTKVLGTKVFVAEGDIVDGTDVPTTGV